jgi:hypothetical protein
MCSTMTDSRLNGLIIINVHKDKLDIGLVVNEFARKKK